MKSVRDPALLDALESLEQNPLTGTFWRSVRSGRPPDQCANSGGRWDDGSFDVLYTSLDKQGAIAERRYHLYQGQPIPPSKIGYELHQLQITLESVIYFRTLEALRAVGLDVTKYGSISYSNRLGEYPRSQEIAEACFFLGADGIVVPNARHDSLNLIVFCEQDTPFVIEKSGEPEPMAL